MSNSPKDFTLPDDFDGVVRLFPLPGLVLFPGVVQALHVFEPRYRAMVEDALSGNELITMALVKPQAIEPIGDSPEIFPTVCIGKILSHNQFEDGRYNLLLMGARRATVVRELASEQPFRVAEVELITDAVDYAPEDQDALQSQIVNLFRQLVDRRGFADVESLSRLFEGGLPLGQLTDLVCYACGVDSLQQQRVLQTADVCRRAEILLRILSDLLKMPQQTSAGKPPTAFPPEFSEN